MESPCLVIANPAYGFPTLPEAIDTAISASRRTAAGETRKIHLTKNNAYSPLEYAYVTSIANAVVGTRTVSNTYEEVRNDSANARTIANESISLQENVHAKYSSQQSILSELDSTNGLYSTLFEQRRASRKRRKCKDLACDATIAFAALTSILLSGAVIAACVAYEFRNISSSRNNSHVRNNPTLSDQCNCTLESELKSNNVSLLFRCVCLMHCVHVIPTLFSTAVVVNDTLHCLFMLPTI